MKETKKKIHVWLHDVKIAEDCMYKRERKDGEGCLCCGGGPMRMLGNAIVHENKTSDVKVRVSVEREELDKLIKDMDRVNRLADETYDKIRKMSKIKIEC